jgi:hypothetical protein
MPQADMPEGVEHALVRQDTACERKLVPGLIAKVAHGDVSSRF